MTFQEVMMKINLKQELKNSYDLLKSINDNIVEETWLNPIEAKLRLQLELLNNWEVLYSEEFSIARFKALLDAHFPYLIGNLKPMTFFVENGFILGDTVTSETTSNSTGSSTSNSTNANTVSSGYAGFDVTNQDGQFQTNKSNGTDTNNSNSQTQGNSTTKVTSTDKIRYLNYLNREFDKWAYSFIREIKQWLLVKIY